MKCTYEDCLSHCKKMAAGQIPHSKVYVIGKQKSAGGGGEKVEIVNPTEQHVEQAKEQMKHIRQDGSELMDQFRKRKATASLDKVLKKKKK